MRLLAIARSVGLASRCSVPRNTTSNSVKTPTAAVQAALAGDFEAVLVCETTSGLDTIQVLRQLREAAVQARVIVLGNNPTVEAAVAAIKEGAADYLHEPCSAEELRAALRPDRNRRPRGRGCRRADRRDAVTTSGRELPGL